jgi:vacuolar-type H+-ATPase subunit H
MAASPDTRRDILHLIDRLEDLVAEARRMPMGQNVLIDRRRILELIDQMRSAVPWEVKEARELTANRDAVLEEARREGEGIVHGAELEAAQKVEESALMKQAETEAQAIVRQAEERSQEIVDDAQSQAQARLMQSEQAASNQMDEADHYALEMLRRLEAQLAAFSTTVQAGIESLTDRAAEAEAEPPHDTPPLERES